MNFPLLVLAIAAAVFGLVTLYLFSRLRQIRIDGDASIKVMMMYLVGAGLIVVMTALFLGRP